MGATGHRFGSWAGFPLLIVAVLLGIASVLEVALYGRWLWLPKLPLAALVAAALLRARPRGRRRA
jgi:uncharacterized iron-regulated membrane protein